MKKSTKILLITAAIMLAFGGLLIVISLRMGGGNQFRDKVMANQLDFNIPGTEQLKLKIGMNGVYFTSEDAQAKESQTKEIPSGENIRSIDVQMAAGEVHFVKSSDEDIHVEKEGNWYLTTEVKDETLVISAAQSGIFSIFTNQEEMAAGKAVIYIPEKIYDSISVEAGACVVRMGDIQADTFSVEVGAGEVSMDSLVADEFRAEVAAGVCEVKKLTAKEMDVEIAMGEFIANGEISEKLSAEVGMGEIQMELLGKEEDYDYSVDCGAGEVRIGSWDYSGIAGDEDRDNPGNKKIDVDCGMGTVDIRFAQ